MRTHLFGRLAILLSLVHPACDSWSGSDDPTKGGVSTGRNPVSHGDGGSAKPDAGMHTPMAAEPDAGAPDGGAERPLGDSRAGHVQCADDSCSDKLHCCTTHGGDAVLSECQSSCGDTEATVVCDGPEDCAKGQVCCHRFGAPGMVTECITVSPGDEDAGIAPATCDAM